MDLVLFQNMPISVRSEIRDMTQWLSLLETHYRSVMFGLLTKLNKLKSEVQSWEKVKRLRIMRKQKSWIWSYSPFLMLQMTSISRLIEKRKLKIQRQNEATFSRKKRIPFVKKVDLFDSSEEIIIQSFFISVLTNEECRTLSR